MRPGGDPEHDVADDRPPDELREQLFRRSTVRLRRRWTTPSAVFGGLPEVEGWEQDGAGGLHR